MSKKLDWVAQVQKYSAVKSPEGTVAQGNLRNKILSLCDDYMVERGPQKIIPGQQIIPASSKILDGNDLKAMVDACLDLWLTTGRFSVEFESKLSSLFGTKSASLTVSGSAANLLAFSALTSDKLKGRRLRPGDEVITVAAGFPTTVFPIVQNGCIPVFVDIKLSNYNIDVNQLEAALSPKTRALMIAHTLGNPFDLNEVVHFCKKYDLFLIEDCCDAFGSLYDGKPVGSFGDMSTVSFYPAHHITTGEGGAVMCKRPFLKTIVESYRDWGRDCFCHTGMNNTCGKRFEWQLGSLPVGYDHKFIYSHVGYNMKMTDIQAALGVSQLDKLPEFTTKRRRNFNELKLILIQRGLDEYFILPEATKHSEPSWFGFLLTIKDASKISRRKLINFIEKEKVLTRLLFAGNLTRQPVFADLKYRSIGDLVVTDKVMNDTFWLGIWPALETEHLSYIADVLEAAVKNQLGGSKI